MPRKDVCPAQPLPVVVLRRGFVSPRALDALIDDRRFSLFVTDALTPEWVALTARLAALFVASEDDPLNALGYALTAGITATIVMLVSKKFRGDYKELLSIGAAACAPLPLTSKELDRVFGLLAPSSGIASFDRALDLLLDPLTHTVRYHDQVVSLSQRQFAVLHLLSAHRGRPVSAEELITTVWGKAPTTNRDRQIVDVYIYQLRRKLERVGLAHTIVTVREFGYALVGASAESLKV